MIFEGALGARKLLQRLPWGVLWGSPGPFGCPSGPSFAPPRPPEGTSGHPWRPRRRQSAHCTSPLAASFASRGFLGPLLAPNGPLWGQLLASSGHPATLFRPSVAVSGVASGSRRNCLSNISPKVTPSPSESESKPATAAKQSKTKPKIPKPAPLPSNPARRNARSD